MSTKQPAAAPVNSASVASPAPAMEVDPSTDDLAATQISRNLKTTCTLDAIRTLNGSSFRQVNRFATTPSSSTRWIT